MLRKAILFFCLNLFLIPMRGFPAASPAPEYPELIRQAGELVRQGQWDKSEIFFLKAAQSPIPDHRIQAYEGLRALYKRLRMEKKAARAKKQLEEAQKFVAKLVPEDESYYSLEKIEPGDTYAKIAARKKISLEWLRRANQRKLLVAGKTIRVPRMQYALIVNKSKKILQWRRGNEILKTYPVAVGKKETQTPSGTFKIVSRVKSPVWYHLKLQIPPESPKNLLGTRWLGLDVKSYGIHGTRDPKSIQAAASHGCVRMHNRDVEELFEWVPIGTKVIIQN